VYKYNLTLSIRTDGDFRHQERDKEKLPKNVKAVETYWHDHSLKISWALSDGSFSIQPFPRKMLFLKFAQKTSVLKESRLIWAITLMYRFDSTGPKTWLEDRICAGYSRLLPKRTFLNNVLLSNNLLKCLRMFYCKARWGPQRGHTALYNNFYYYYYYYYRSNTSIEHANEMVHGPCAHVVLHDRIRSGPHRNLVCEILLPSSTYVQSFGSIA
jgi:hypothetical protein